MLGRRRANNIGTQPDADGATDPTSAAYSPALSNETIYGNRVDVHRSPPGFDVQDPGVAAADYRVGPSNYIDNLVGGQAGSNHQLGWSTGLIPRKVRRTPLTGRVLVRPSMGVHPVIGEVGRSNPNKLWAGVRDQQTNYIPDTTQIARGFTGRFQLDSDTEDE